MTIELRAPQTPRTPLIVTVLHAGRDYRRVEAELRVPPNRLVALEDRYVDLLVDDLAGDGHACLIAHEPRAWIDLNRQLGDLDPGMVEGGRPRPLSLRARQGLGLVPRRLQQEGELWVRPLDATSMELRLASWHAFRTALRRQVDATLTRFGRCILLDLHSMPPIGDLDAVLGDNHGRTCTAVIADTVMTTLARAGWRMAANAPYAGGALVREFGQPRRQVNAVQLELDRRLYLDADLVNPGPALPDVRRVLARLGNELAGETRHLAQAAE